MFTAFFQEEKQTFTSMEDAMEWVDSRAVRRMAIRGHEAVDLGYADIFNG